MLRITPCKGEGYGSCTKCREKNYWNVMWMCFLYEVEGMEGTYCHACAEKLRKVDENDDT